MEDNNIKDHREVDLMEIFKEIWKKRKFVLKVTIISIIVGIVVAFSLPAEYTVKVKMAHEGSSISRNMSSGNMFDLAALAGISSNSSTEGINFALYPDVVSSIPFVVEMSNIPVQGKKMTSAKKLYDYVGDDLKSPWWNKLISLPGKIIGGILSIFREKEMMESEELDIRELSLEQSNILNTIKNRFNVYLDKKTGIITASATMQDPRIATIIVDSLVAKLETYMVQYKTNKALRDLEFTTTLFEEAEKKFYETQKRLAEFNDANQYLARSIGKVEQSRLQNEAFIALEVYKNLSQQLDVAKIKVQEQTPVVTIIEPATVPVFKSGKGELFILCVFVFLGIAIAGGVIAFKNVFLITQKD